MSFFLLFFFSEVVHGVLWRMSRASDLDVELSRSDDMLKRLHEAC